MNSARRLQYLTALDIVPLRPHRSVPGAKPSALVTRRKAEPASTLQQGVVERQPQAPSGQGRPRAADMLGSTAASAKPRRTRHSTPKAPQTPEQPQADVTKQTPAQAAPSAAAFFVLECPAELLIVDLGHHSDAQLQLLRNIMFALTRRPMEEYRALPVDWAQTSIAGDVADVVRGLVDRSAVQYNTARLLLMGEAAQQLFCPQPGHGVLQAISDSHPGLSAVGTYSSADLLQQPLLKAETWQHVQALRVQS